MKIDKSKYNKNGFSLIELLIVIVIIGVIAAIAIPNLMLARRASNEASAISSVSIIYRSENAYRMAEGNGEFTDLATLHDKNYIDQTLGSGSNVKSGYSFETQVFPSSPIVDSRINVRARPIVHSQVNSIIGTGGIDLGVTEVGGIHSTSDNTPVTFDDNTRLPTGSATPIDGN